jgi:hypothetical protein
MDSAGLSDVRVIHPPADGVTGGLLTMPLVGREGARLEVVEPLAPEEFRVG